MSDAALRASRDVLQAGDEAPMRQWTVTRADLEQFAEFLYPARPDNPQRLGNPHLDEAYATKHLGGLIVDGNQTVALLCDLVTDWLAMASIGCADTEAAFTFPNPCRVGDVVTFAAKVLAVRHESDRSRVELQATAINQAGKLVAKGTVLARMPAQGKDHR